MRYINIIIITLSLQASAAFANRLHSAYSIPYGRSDRIIVEFDDRPEFVMTSPSPDMLEIQFDDAQLSSDFRLSNPPDQLTVIQSITPHANDAGQLVLTIRLLRPTDPTGTTLTSNPWRYAVDLTPKGANAGQVKPTYVPGDRPFRTSYSQSDPLDGGEREDIRLSRTAFVVSMLLVFAAGAMSVFATGYGLQLLRKRFRRSSPRPNPSASPLDLLNLELETDLARLKQMVEWEKADVSEGTRRIHDERERLILQLLKEGRQLDAIAKALSMTPDQIRQILHRQP